MNRGEQTPLTTEYIKLQDLLKYASLVSTGGEAKARILAGEAAVNGAPCTQRGKQLRPGDTVTFGGRTRTVYYAD